VRSIVSCLGLFVFAAMASATDAPSVSFPDGFRDWHHVKTGVVLPGNPMYPFIGGINHTYANAQAMQGYASGKFPDGATLVFDTIEAHDADHAIEEGRRKVLGVMTKDSKRYAATDGWGFENFEAGDPKHPVFGAKAAAACFGCHSKPGTHDHVYSRLRE
jgi:hypothetical protein